MDVRNIIIITNASINGYLLFVCQKEVISIEYLDGVRKVYGKVKIVYADKDVSKELKVNASGESEISYKNEVVLGYNEPSVKACTMDGNSVMGGKHQMRDKDQICGWWSDSRSDGVGCYTAPFPYLEASFIERPILEWWVVGDVKLGQFPIDFDLICYNKNSLELSRQQINGNYKVLINIEFTVVPIGVTRIRLEVHRWNKPNCKAKIMSFYTLLEEEYLGSDLKDFEVLQELSEQTDNVTYGISSDTATITIYNKDRKFDRGYLKELVLLDRKVIPYIGIERNNKVEYTQLGEFYSDEWKVPGDNMFAKVVCVDKLMRLQDIIYLGFPLTKDVSLYDLIQDVLTKAGYNNKQFCIDEKAKNMIVKNAYLTKGSSWDSLQEILSSGLLKCYINKQGILEVSSGENKGKYTENITAKNILRYSKSDKMTDFANKINVSYSSITTDEAVITVYEGGIFLEPLGETTSVLDYNGLITNVTIDYKSVEGLELACHNAYANCGEVTFKNTSDKIIYLIVSVKGNAIKMNTQTINVCDNDSIDRFGIKSYSHNSSFLLQSYDGAIDIGNKLLQRLSSNSRGQVDIEFRGDPSLNLEQEFECSNRYGDSNKSVCEYNRYVFDGGLKQQTKGRIIKGGNANGK